MRKKKSYMNKDNILSEGFFFNLAKHFVSKLSDVAVEVNKSEIKKVEKELEDLEKRKKESKENFKRLMKKYYNVDIKDGALKKRMDKLGV